MSEQPCEMIPPGTEHQKLLEGVGQWNVKCKTFMAPGAPPMESDATDTVVAVGGFWTVSDFKTTLGPMGPFHGMCTMGYDQRAKKYVMTWIDSMSSHLFVMDGGYDKSGKILTLTGMGPSMMSPELVNWKSVTEMVSKDEMIMKMYVESPHGDMQILENRYTRRK
jgi:hypothetical protein